VLKIIRKKIISGLEKKAWNDRSMVRGVRDGKGTAVACPELVCVCQIFATHKSCYFTKASETQQVCVYIHTYIHICRNKCVNVCVCVCVCVSCFLYFFNFSFLCIILVKHSKVLYNEAPHVTNIVVVAQMPLTCGAV